MLVHGKVKNGVVVLDARVEIPEGTRVSVLAPNPPSKKNAKAGKKKKRPIMQLAGKARGLPPDASRNLKHYLYGHPKV